MTYAISTSDGNGQPVKNATISFTKDGAVFNEVVFPDNTGVLYFDSASDSDLFTDDVSVRVTAPGYNPAGTTGNAIHGDWVFTLRSNGYEKAAIVGGIIVGAVLLSGGLAAGKKGRHKVAGIDIKKDVLPWVPAVAVLGGGYLLYKMFFAQSPEDEKRDQALSDDIANAAAVEPPRMIDSEIAATANALKEDLTYAGVSNNYVDAAHQLTKPGTQADLLRLIKQYGKQIITFFGIPTGSYTLEETVSRQMPREYIDEINQYYAAQGINFKF